MNADRAAHGAGPLKGLFFDPTNYQHAQDEAACACIFHQDSRYPNESFPYPSDNVYRAENTGYASSVAQVDQSMMAEGPCPDPNCPNGEFAQHGHYLNIIDPEWQYLAIGIAYGAQYWGQATYVVEDFR